MKHPTFRGKIWHGNEDAGEYDRDYLLHYGDTAYGAMDKVVEGIHHTTPYKRQPGQDLTPEQRAFNKEHSGVRILGGKRHPKDKDLPEHEGKVPKQDAQVRSYQ